MNWNLIILSVKTFFSLVKILPLTINVLPGLLPTKMGQFALSANISVISCKCHVIEFSNKFTAELITKGSWTKV